MTMEAWGLPKRPIRKLEDRAASAVAEPRCPGAAIESPAGPRPHLDIADV